MELRERSQRLCFHLEELGGCMDCLSCRGSTCRAAERLEGRALHSGPAMGTAEAEWALPAGSWGLLRNRRGKASAVTCRWPGWPGLCTEAAGVNGGRACASSRAGGQGVARRFWTRGI